MDAIAISIVNPKGGVGKTTTASLLAAGLVRKGYKVLAIDAASQGNMSSALHADSSDNCFCLADLMGRITVRDDDGYDRKIQPEDAVQHTDYSDVIASNIRTAKAAEMFNEEDRLYFLSDLLESFRPNYDFIIFDTGPAKDNMVKNCLIASDGAIIPTISAEYATNGIVAMNDTLRQARRKNLNPDLKLYGILLTKYQKNLITSKQTLLDLTDCAEAMGTKLFNTIIRTDENVNKSQMEYLPKEMRKFDQETGIILYDFAPKSSASLDYMDFIDELLSVINNNQKHKNDDENDVSARQRSQSGPLTNPPEEKPSIDTNPAAAPPTAPNASTVQTFVQSNPKVKKKTYNYGANAIFKTYSISRLSNAAMELCSEKTGVTKSSIMHEALIAGLDPRLL